MGLPGADLFSLWIQVSSTVMFCLVFLFLWRQSGIVYFGLWSAAWAVQSVALVLGAYFLLTGSAVTLIPYAFLEFAYATLLVAAARAGFSGSIRNWKGALKILFGFPIFLAAWFVVVERSGPETVRALHVLLLGSVYLYNFTSIRGHRLGMKLFRFSLFAIATAFIYHAVLLLLVYRTSPAPGWLLRLQYNVYYDFVFNTLLSFAAMAMWIESQHDSVHEVAGELDRVRRESARNMDLDRLTGLLNQSALSKRIDDPAGFKGVVAVCDMDDFKEINDRYGHLVGDEILRSVGHLLRTSIRPEDEAFRWGGDEFVVLFSNGDAEVVSTRMREIAQRLQAFRIRGHGVLPITFSWGASAADSRPLREAVDEADRRMYEFKRSRR
jgi:diguanylate cyclase (GGDEF)-like protein